MSSLTRRQQIETELWCALLTSAVELSDITEGAEQIERVAERILRTGADPVPTNFCPEATRTIR